MIWKRAFFVLGCLNLLLFLLFGLWFISLPSAAEIQPPSINQNAKVQLAFGEDAINTYLSYAVSERPDLKRFLSFVRVDFSNTWTVDFGVKYGNIINSNLKIGALPVI